MYLLVYVAGLLVEWTREISWQNEGHSPFSDRKWSDDQAMKPKHTLKQASRSTHEATQCQAEGKPTANSCDGYMPPESDSYELRVWKSRLEVRFKLRQRS